APQRGRGTSENPPNRFIPLYRERYDDWVDPEDPAPATRFFHDGTKSILTANDSPDIPFEATLNPYRGCEHGCIYCYARPTHEWFGLSAGLDFETKIFVKTEAPALLRRELMKKSWEPTTLSISGITDCYQPAERHFKITGQCL